MISQVVGFHSVLGNVVEELAVLSFRISQFVGFHSVPVDLYMMRS